MLRYTMMLKNKNDKDNHRMEKDNKDNKDNKNDSVKKAGNKRKRTSNSNITRRNNKKCKRGTNGSDSDSSESERDYDYVPPEKDSSTEPESESDSESVDESEYELLKENSKNIKRSRPTRKAAQKKSYKETDSSDESESDENKEQSEKFKGSFEDLDKEAEEEYEKYLEKLAEEMGDNIYDRVKSKLTKEKDSDKITKPEVDCCDISDDKKGNIGTILILSQAPGKTGKNEAKGGYNLRKNAGKYEILTPDEKQKLEETEKMLFELNRHKIPPRHKVLLSQMTLASKAKIIENMDRVNNMNSYSSEYSKLTRWIDGVLKLPFGKYYELPISLSSPNNEITSYLTNVENVMDKCIYGQRTAKEKILEFVGKWITNPNSTNEPLAFVGEKGTGKTTLAKEGIAKALGRPFCMVSLGGESDAASFKGHDYTYEGSRWGRIADMIIGTQCMNPVIFFDELDKLSTTRSGEEITGMLMHLTDTTQNDKFSDKYFSGIDIDLSKALFIFSYNDPEKLNPILRDRLTEIKFSSFKKQDKLIIAKNFLIKRACENIGLKIDDYILNDETLSNLIEKYTPREESGVRSLKRIIETLFLRLNLFQLPQNLNISYKNMKIKSKKGKYKISDTVLTELLKDMVPNMSQAVLSMYA